MSKYITNSDIIIISGSSVIIGKDTANAQLDISGSGIVSGSFTVTQGITGSLYGTSSWADNSISASYVLQAISASYAFNSTSASYAATSSYSTETSNVVIYVRNQSGYNINKGVVVRITGSNNSSDIPRIVTASYENDNNSANTLGITDQAIANGSDGYVITEGILLGINTSNFTSGQLIYLGATGSITGSAPMAPLHAVRLGEVIRQQSNNGSIYVRIDNGYELDELHNVVIVSQSSGDLLVASGSVWYNTKQLTGSYGLTGSLQATSFTGSLQGTASWASNALTSSYIIQSISASYASSSTSASYAATASYVQIAQTASYYGGSVVSASYASSSTSASFAVLAQTANTASYVLQAVSSSYALTASLAPNYVLTSVTSSMLAPYVLTSQTSSMTVATASYVTGSVHNSTNPALSASYALTASYAMNGGGASFPYTGNAIITGSLTITGSTISTLGFTGSLQGTSSWANNTISASYSLTASYVQNAVSASYILQAVSSSYSNLAQTSNTASYVVLAQTASYVQNAQTASYVNLAQTASYVNLAQTASYILQAVSASYSSTSSLPLRGIITASAANTTITFTKGDGSTFDVTVSQSGSVATASYAIFAQNANTSSYALTASYVQNAISASYASTASYVQNAISASYILQAVSASYSTLSQTANTASYVVLAQTASYVQNAQTASYVLQSVSSSYASTASYYGGSVISSSYASTSSYVLQAVSASYATLAQTANTASYVVTAQTASYVLQAVSASYASNGGVTKIVAGTNITISPSTGLGDVTINSTGGGSSTQIATGSVTASVSPSQFSVVSGSSTELVVTGTGVTLGNVITDTHRVTGSLNISGSVLLSAGNLTDGQNALNVTTTMPTTITALSRAIYFNITSAGSSSFTNRGLDVNYAAGYTGSSATACFNGLNSAAGTATIATTLSTGNFGISANANGTTTGTNIGSRGTAGNGDINIGNFGYVEIAKNSATNIGVAGLGLNTGTTPVQIGGFFGLMNTKPTFTSAALMADNGSQTDPIFVARDNGTSIFSINDVATDHVVSIAAGTILDGKNAMRLTATMPTTITANLQAVSFDITSAGSSSFTQTSLIVNLNAGYTGSSTTTGVTGTNAAAGTGSDVLGSRNQGSFYQCTGTTTGTNVGMYGSGANGDKSFGVVGRAITAKNSGYNIGVAGFGINTGTTPVHIGGYFGLHSSTPIFTSAALMSDNGSTTDPIFVARDNGTVVVQLSDGGFFGIGNGSTAATSQLQVNKNQNSVTQADANGILLANSTAAIAGTQSISPPIVWQGNGWSTGSSASQDVRFRADVLPTQSSSANATWRLAYSLNGSAYSNAITVDTVGSIAFSLAATFSSSVTVSGVLIQSNFRASTNNAYQSVQFLVGLADTATQSYRTTNAGSDINTRLLCVYNNSNSTSGTLGIVADAVNGLMFTAANGTRMIARAAITIGNLTNTAGSEAGDLLFHTQNSGAAYTQKMRISKSGNIVLGNEAALSTSATDGFAYIPSGAGTPTGVPTAYTGKVPMYWDSTNKKLYIYDGSWLGGTVPGAWT